MAIAALGIELERRWGAERYEPAEEPAADRKPQSAVLNRAAAEGNEQKAQDATETTDNPADEEPIGKPRQRLSSGGADGASLLARSSEASAAQTLGDKQGTRSTSTAEQLSRTTTPSLGFIGRSEGRGGAIAASTTSTSSSPQASSSSGVQISGTFLAGPVVSQNSIGIRAYSEDGVLLATTGVNSDGSYRLTLPEGYTGYVLIEAVDLDPATPDYVDERTKTAQNLTTALRTIGYVGGVDQTLHVNPITEITAQKLGLAEGATTFKALGLRQALIDAAEAEVAGALGIPTDFMTGTAPISTINTDGTVVSGVSDAYGIALAAISGAEVDSSTSAVLKAIATGISPSGLDQTVNTMLINGAMLADQFIGENLIKRMESGDLKLSYQYDNIFPLIVPSKQTITDKSLIGTEDYPHGPTEEHNPIYWPGTRTSKIIINDQPGVIKDVAVAFALTGNSTNDTSRIFVTLISPSGVRIPIAGTTIDPKYLSYRDTTTKAPTTFGLQLKADESKGYLYAETEESIANYSLDNSIKEKITQETSSLSLASLTALTGATPNGVWQLEVKNSSDASIQLDSWQLLLKSEESNTKTDSNGDYRFEAISPSTVSGPITPWVTLPSDRELISPTGKLNADVRLAEQSPLISFGLSTKGSAASATDKESESWSRFDLSTLISPDSLLPKTTLSQAVTAMEADSARAKYGVDGEGIKIGLLSSTWNQLGGAEWDYKTGVLNKDKITVSLAADNVEIKDYTMEGNDEGRSMAQLIHSIAPGAEINFHSWDDGVFKYFIDKAATKDAADPDRDELIRSAFTNYDKQVEKWKEALISLARAGYKIMVDDLDDAEPWFQDGGMTRAISEVIRDYGVTYFTAAGNFLNNSYTSAFNAKTISDIGESSEDFKKLPTELQQELRAGHELHLFQGKNGNSTFMQEITLAKQINLQWNSLWGQNDKTLKVLLFTKGEEGFEYASNATIIQDPDGIYPWAQFRNPNKKEDGSIDYKKPFYLSVIHPGTSSNTRPDVFKWIQPDPGNTTVSTDSDLGFYESTIYGHAAGADSANVGSIQYWSTPAYRADKTELSKLSSWGVTPIYFEYDINSKSYTKLAEPEIRENPAFAVPQKVDTSFFSHGYDLQYDSEGDFLQNFEGTSAAAPNAAAVAALMLQLNPKLTNKQIINILKGTATQIQIYDHTTPDENGFNRASGYGLINAMDALDQIAQLKLSGTVYEDTNADGKQSVGELGLEGIQVFLDSNGNGQFDQNSTWQSFLATASGGNSISEVTKPTLVVDEITGLPIDSRYENIIHGTDSLSSNTPFSDRSLLISSITSASDYDVITEGGKDLTLNGDLLLHFDGASSTTAGSYSILKADSISGSFDNILIKGLSDNLYFGIGIEGGDNIQVTVSEDYFVGSTKAGSLL